MLHIKLLSTVTFLNWHLHSMNSELVENVNHQVSELCFRSSRSLLSSLSLLNSTVLHTKTYSEFGIKISGCCPSVKFSNTRMRFTKQNDSGISILTNRLFMIFHCTINDCQFEKSHSTRAILYVAYTRSMSSQTVNSLITQEINRSS